MPSIFAYSVSQHFLPPHTTFVRWQWGWVRGLLRTFKIASKKKVYSNGQKTWKCEQILNWVIKEMHVKATARNYYILRRTWRVQFQVLMRVWDQHSSHANLYNHSVQPNDLANPFSDISQVELSIHLFQTTCARIFTAMIFKIAPNQKQSKCLSTVQWINSDISI